MSRIPAIRLALKAGEAAPEATAPAAALVLAGLEG
jgi:hypothetical protein